MGKVAPDTPVLSRNAIFWRHTQETELDNDELQGTSVSLYHFTLLDDVEDFDGQSSMCMR